MNPVTETNAALAPYFSDGQATIYKGSAQTILPQLGLRDDPWGVVHVVTDPPYGIGLDYGTESDRWRPDHTFWRLLEDHTPPATSLHMTVSNRHLPFWLYEVTREGWTYLHTSVYWNQSRAGGNHSGRFAYAWEPLVSFAKYPDSFELGKRMLSDVFTHNGQRTTPHPAERNISAWTSFIDHLPAGLIIDPFLGSGTTLRAALNLGRSAIGIEREERWCRAAALRCAQMSLFVS